MTDRRDFLGALLAGVAFAGPLETRAQVPGRTYRLGVLRPTGPLDTESALQPALREQGYVEGQNLVVERRYADGRPERLPALARELVALNMDAILAVGSAAVLAAMAATKTKPIVMYGNFDPVAIGFVKSLARPGGNVTGLLIAPEGTLAGKKLDLLRRAVPNATRIAVLAPDDPNLKPQAREVQKAAASLGLSLFVVEVRGGDYERAFAEIAAQKPQALFVTASAYFMRDRRQIIDLAARHRLPAIYEWREQVLDGGLMAYGTSQPALYQRLAVYIDRLFDGAKPEDMPIEQPTKFELVVNLKTARALGLAIPQALLLRADEVIE